MEFKEILERRTIRRFEQRKIEDGILRAMIDAARRASCAGNRQRLRYAVVRTPEKVLAILPHTAYAALVKPRRDPVAGKTAPAVFIAVWGTTPPDAMLYADAGAAIQSMEFAAWEHGIGVCWLGSFDRGKAAAAAGVDPERLLFLAAAGYKAESPVGEEIGGEEPTAYFLDGNDVLHVPKYSVDALTVWL